MDRQYSNHSVFNQLSDYASFYKHLSYNVMNWGQQGTITLINLDTFVYSSIQGTIESIKDILIKGRINDAYALLRKYYDSTIINVYSNLYIIDNYNIFFTEIFYI